MHWKIGWYQCLLGTPIIASFPGSPHARTKNGKERWESGKIYHVRNVTGREDLITRGRTEAKHSVCPLIMQVSSPGRWHFLLHDLQVSKKSAIKFLKALETDEENSAATAWMMDAKVDCKPDILEPWWRRLMHIWHGMARIVVSKKIIF